MSQETSKIPKQDILWLPFPLMFRAMARAWHDKNVHWSSSVCVGIPLHWVTCFWFHFWSDLGNSSTTTNSVIIIMGVGIYVPLFQRAFFSIITCKQYHNVDPALFLPPKSPGHAFFGPLWWLQLEPISQWTKITCLLLVSSLDSNIFKNRNVSLSLYFQQLVVSGI